MLKCILVVAGIAFLCWCILAVLTIFAIKD